MKYAITKCINGNFSVHSEGFTDIVRAKVIYHGLCQTYWNADDVYTATIAIVDENLDIVHDCKEYIYHPQEENIDEVEE